MKIREAQHASVDEMQGESPQGTIGIGLKGLEITIEASCHIRQFDIALTKVINDQLTNIERPEAVSSDEKQKICNLRENRWSGN